MLFNSPAMNGKVLSKKVSFQTELDPLINSKLEEICETGRFCEIKMKLLFGLLLSF